MDLVDLSQVVDIVCHSSEGIQEACSYLHSQGQSTANVKGVLTSWTSFAIRTGSRERQNTVNLDWIIIKVWYCAYCVQPYLLDLVSLVALQICMEEEHERNIRMHVYTYALRGGEVTYLHGIVNKPDCMGHSIQVFIKRDT